MTHVSEFLKSAGAGEIQLLGEIITYDLRTGEVAYDVMLESLESAGLDKSAARALLPRHAFSRACNKLREHRVIRPIKDDGPTSEDVIRFQFTREFLEGEKYNYSYEAILMLDKKTGTVTSGESLELAYLAQDKLDHCMAHRTQTDITRLVQRLFEANADLFPIRDKGGAYFVPDEHREFVDKVEDFVHRVGGKVNRFPVPSGTQKGAASVRDVVADGIKQMIDEHKAAVASFTETTRDDTLDRFAERIKTTQHKLDAYACYLGAQRETLEESLAEAKQLLKSHIEKMTADTSAAATAEDVKAQPLFRGMM